MIAGFRSQLRFLAIPVILGLAAPTLIPVSVVAAAPNATFTLQKSVTVNGLGYSTSGTARAGDVLTYHLMYRNTSATTATNVLVTDYLAPGQIPLNSLGAGCTYSSTTRVVTCQIAAVGPNSQGNIYITTGIETGFNGLIPNTAQLSADNVVTTTSNTTQVGVGSPLLSIPGLLSLCGIVSAYTPYQLTIDGFHFALAPSVAVSNPIIAGRNYCLTLIFDGKNLVASIQVVTNLPGVNLACGVLSVAGATSLTLSGLTFSIAAGGGTLTLETGQYYCFLLNSDLAVIGVLTLIPTLATPSPATGASYRLGRLRAG